MKGEKEMTAAYAIDKIISAPSKRPTYEEAQKLLRSCGILDNKNNVKSVYKEFLIQESDNEHDSK